MLTASCPFFLIIFEKSVFSLLRYGAQCRERILWLLEEADKGLEVGGETGFYQWPRATWCVSAKAGGVRIRCLKMRSWLGFKGVSTKDGVCDGYPVTEEHLF